MVPFVDCAVALADEMNARLGVGFNHPETSSLRRDKFLQQAESRGWGGGWGARRQVPWGFGLLLVQLETLVFNLRLLFANKAGTIGEDVLLVPGKQGGTDLLKK